MAKKAYIGIVEFAKQIDKTPQYVRRLIKNGKITKRSLKTEGKRKLIQPEKAVADLENNISFVNKKNLKTNQNEPKNEPIKRNTENETGDELSEAFEGQLGIVSAAGLTNASLAEAQKIKERFAAALKKLEYEEKSKTLVRATTVEKEAFAMARLTRDSIMAVVDRNAAVLAAETDEKVVADILRDELAQALEFIAAE
ncbi:hypothetical protein [Desulfoluna spongiiphila]|uniref:hypothetical protein n=1 Tax=Desulfoluna spongiiphila TaxID=419481 RepID=UPI0012510563|nr:hypothetical protein [Desulfoluna spongiiphila]VVS95344.1 consensus disorder prediction [Desulfoluna spongiiphila]